MKHVIFSADDFGMSVEVNEAIEEAHVKGVLSTASLMVAGPAAGDAIKRAKRLPSLKVGLHLVVIEGHATLPPCDIPELVGKDGIFPSQQLKMGIDYFFRQTIRRSLRAEIAAQFRAYKASGLPLDHANAHKHMHLHPTVGHMLINIGREYNLRAIRVPNEPAYPNYSETPIQMGDTALRYWTQILRFQIKKARMVTTNWCFGLAGSGHMTEKTVTKLLDNLPRGISEIYFHPATEKCAYLNHLMPDYEHQEEFSALCSPQIRNLINKKKIALVTWGNLLYQSHRRN